MPGGDKFPAQDLIVSTWQCMDSNPGLFDFRSHAHLSCVPDTRFPRLVVSASQYFEIIPGVWGGQIVASLIYKTKESSLGACGGE